MRQKIRSLQDTNTPITDRSVVFTAMYNLLYDRIDSEPNKGIVISKGNPNQRKEHWAEVLNLAHMLEDFFMIRELRVGKRTCSSCGNWTSISKESPWIGRCSLKGEGILVHSLDTCKKHKEEK